MTPRKLAAFRLDTDLIEGLELKERPGAPISEQARRSIQGWLNATPTRTVSTTPQLLVQRTGIRFHNLDREHVGHDALQQNRASADSTNQQAGKLPPSLATNDGKGIMFVSHTGEIYPSGFLPIAAGVFPRDGLVQTYQYSPLFQALREPRRLKGKCAVCKFRNVCGGSRARAYAVTGDPLAAEPDCAYVPEGWPHAAAG